MRKYFVIGAILILMVLGTAVVNAQATEIDNFSSGERNFTTDEAATLFARDQASTAEGGWRKLKLVNLVGGAQSTARVTSALQNQLRISTEDDGQYEVTVIWDGEDNTNVWDGDSIDFQGLGGLDLVYDDSSPPEQIADGILVTIVGWDGRDVDLAFTVYTDEDNFSTATYQVRGNIFVGSYDVALCFFEGCFSVAGGSGADFTNVGAIVMEVKSMQPGADITLDLTFADPTRDFGDLPDSYTTTISDTAAQLDVNEEGARHSRGNTYLGACVTRELNGQPGDAADSDGCDDGIQVIGTDNTRWQNGPNGGAVRVTWNSPDRIGDSGSGNGSACLDGWINWDHRDSDSSNHTFETSTNFSAEQKFIIRGLRLQTNSFSALTQDITFDVPEGYFPGGSGDPLDLASRWRIYPVSYDAEGEGFCPTDGLGLEGFKGYIINGEVEDYIWGFTPTAVSLQSTSASTSSSVLLGLVAIFALTLVSAGALIYRRQLR